MPRTHNHTAATPNPNHRPWVVCNLQWGNGDFAPGVDEGQAGKYKCGHHLLLAHAMAVKAYRDRWQSKQRGKVSIALWSEWSEPYTDSPAGQCKG